MNLHIPILSECFLLNIAFWYLHIGKKTGSIYTQNVCIWLWGMRLLSNFVMFTLCRGGEGKRRKEDGRKYIYAWVLFFGTTACLLEQCVTTDFALSLVWEHWHYKCEGTKGFIPPQSCSTWLHGVFMLD